MKARSILLRASQWRMKILLNIDMQMQRMHVTISPATVRPSLRVPLSISNMQLEALADAAPLCRHVTTRGHGDVKEGTMYQVESLGRDYVQEGAGYQVEPPPSNLAADALARMS